MKRLGILLGLSLVACVIYIPDPVPSPSPTPGPTTSPSPISTPTPVPTPTPTPEDPPTPTPLGYCALPPQPDCGGSTKVVKPDGSVWWGCCVETDDRGDFYNIVVEAQKELERTRPDLFIAPGRTDPDNPKRYTLALAQLLQYRYSIIGVCAASGGPEDEIGVKNTNAWNEQYDVVVGDGRIWTNKTVKCGPARF